MDQFNRGQQNVFTQFSNSQAGPRVMGLNQAGWRGLFFIGITSVRELLEQLYPEVFHPAKRLELQSPLASFLHFWLTWTFLFALPQTRY